MMGKSNRHDKFVRLREEYPVFVYEGVDWVLDGEGIRAGFRFAMGEKHRFNPSFFIPRKEFFLPDEEIRPFLPGLVFHIGMIELLSYWKAACPPVVEVRAGAMTGGQAKFWQELFYKGLGEFRFVNGIDCDARNFVSFHFADPALASPSPFTRGDRGERSVRPGILIPVGGGKDSVVTLELLGKMEGSLPLVLNPTKAAIKCIERAGVGSQEVRKSGSQGSGSQEVFEVRRELDPLLLQLNDQGFLNGHTPFSAMLAFYTLLAAHVAGKRQIALSNESSANEPTIPGTEINHQYSKSREFETNFRRYVKEYLSPDTEYFSFLRPLHEIQIAKLFSGYRQYHDVFRSCNAGSKTGAWCGKCSKCLFTYIILSPFLPGEEMVRIFGRDLFGDRDLELFFDQLTGTAPEKPFDCVGTIDEVNAAVQAVIRRRQGETLPYLLERYSARSPVTPDASRLETLLNAFDPEHHVPPDLHHLLTSALNG